MIAKTFEKFTKRSYSSKKEVFAALRNAHTEAEMLVERDYLKAVKSNNRQKAGFSCGVNGCPVQSSFWSVFSFSYFFFFL